MLISVQLRKQLNEVELHKKTNSKTNKLILSKYVHNWTEVDTTGQKWTEVDTCGHKWTLVDTSGNQWTLVNICGYKWTQVDET